MQLIKPFRSPGPVDGLAKPTLAEVQLQALKSAGSYWLINQKIQSNKAYNYG